MKSLGVMPASKQLLMAGSPPLSFLRRDKPRSRSGLQGRRVGCDLQNLVFAQFSDDGFHEFGPLSPSGFPLHVVKLSGDVAGRAAGDAGHGSQSVQTFSVADTTSFGPAVRSRFDQQLAFAQ